MLAKGGGLFLGLGQHHRPLPWRHKESVIVYHRSEAYPSVPTPRRRHDTITIRNQQRQTAAAEDNIEENGQVLLRENAWTRRSHSSSSSSNARLAGTREPPLLCT